MNRNKNRNILITGGGTGGHIYPGLAIANVIKEENPLDNILFVGCKYKMEMNIVPKEGYYIIGLPILGYKNKSLFKKILAIFYFIFSLFFSLRIFIKYRPDIIIGTGGYASLPILFLNKLFFKKIFFIQEQNSYYGLVNNIFKHKAKAVFVNNISLLKDNVYFTGNPIRKSLILKAKQLDNSQYKLNKTILILGGSQGSTNINDAIIKDLKLISSNNIKIYWQTGYFDYNRINKLLNNNKKLSNNIYLYKYLYNIQDFYYESDLIVCRAGAMTLSELSIFGKPLIIVPIENSANNHQIENAKRLSDLHAAVVIREKDLNSCLVNSIFTIINNDSLYKQMSSNIRKTSNLDAAYDIVNIINKFYYQKINLL